MGVVVGLLAFFLLAVEILLIARMVLDMVGGLAPRNPLAARSRNDWVCWVFAGRLATHALTEPVLKPVRRVVPPLRVGSKLVDLALILLFVAVVVLRTVLVGL